MVLATLIPVVAATAVVAGTAGPASAAGCRVSVYGLRQDSRASFWQEVSFELCAGPSGTTAKVGVWMQPFGGYAASHIIGCSAHLELTDLTLGSTTRSDRPVNCTTKAQHVTLSEPYPGIPIGPSSWTNQNLNHSFLARAWINIQTGAATYKTETHASACDFPNGNTAGTMCYLSP
jgi:hypothetical protein